MPPVRSHRPDGCHWDGEALPRPAAVTPGEAQLLADLRAGLNAPGAVVERAAMGRRFVGIGAGGRVGLASTLGARPGPGDGEQISRLPGRTLADATRMLLGRSPLLASIGLAALCAGMNPQHAQSGAHTEERLCEACRGREAVVIGDFPFLPKIRSVAGRCHLFELRDVSGRTPPALWDDVLGGCQVAIITGTALLTRSLNHILTTARQALKLIIGPSTPLSPVLFDYGVDVLAGSRVVAPDSVLAGVEAGLPFREIKRLGVEPVWWSRPGPGDRSLL